MSTVTQERIELEAVVREQERRARTFLDFVHTHNPTLLRYEHVPRLVDVAERIVRGELTRVIIIEPPRYFKSEVFSRMLPAFYLRRHPSRRVADISYGAELAWELSEEAKNYFLADGGSLRLSTRAKKHWSVANGFGGMWAVGVGGAMLGRGYHLGVVDDPVDPEKAASPTYQKRFQTWWPSKFLSRQDKNAAIVVVMQRLGVQDPIDFLFRKEVGENTDEAPQYWHVVLCDEIKSDAPLGRWDGPMGLPPTCTLEPDERPKGQVLAPTLLSKEEVEVRQREAGSITTAAQRQGRPMTPKGDFWQRKWFRVIDEVPPEAYNRGRDWDTAYTKDEANAATAWIKSSRGPARDKDDNEWPVYIEDIDWDWLEFPAMVDKMRSLDGPHYVEAKASGKSSVQALKAYKVMAEEVQVSGDKFARAAAAQPAVANGRIYVLKRVVKALLDAEGQGLMHVTAEALQGQVSGALLDVNDVFVQCLHRHLKLSEQKSKRYSVSFA